ncbi:MAG: hypothetical protein PHI12_14420 [Dehalococcoidales bacterium]|nr:hypothetical protein [Dehalococcoidales bacterium]
MKGDLVLNAVLTLEAPEMAITHRHWLLRPVQYSSSVRMLKQESHFFVVPDIINIIGELIEYK